MKKVIVTLLCFISLHAAAQDTVKTKHKEYLGVLTLTEKFKEEKSWTKKDQEIVGEHFQRLVKMKNDGVVLLAGRTSYELNNPAMMGLVIFYAKNDEEAQHFMMEDPAVKNNIMLAKVHPYGVAVSKCE